MIARERCLLLLMIAGLLLPLTAHAQETSAGMFSEEALQAVAAAVIADEATPEAMPRSSRDLWVMTAWLTAATIYDVESTLHLLARCDECQEANPIVRPFVERGRFATYAYSAAVNAIVMYMARRMYLRGDTWWRVFPLALTAVHGVAGTWNWYRGGRD